jgi:hypothetical protein
MNRQEFIDDLPNSTDCVICHENIEVDEWGTMAAKDGGWIGLCVVKCKCGWVKVAAAGSTEKAHKQAQQMRSEYLRTIGK